MELITYRIGDHSTSDHSVLYRTEEELKHWKNTNNPIHRLGLYLKQSGIRDMDEQSDINLRKSYRNDAIKGINIYYIFLNIIISFLIYNTPLLIYNNLLTY